MGGPVDRRAGPPAPRPAPDQHGRTVRTGPRPDRRGPRCWAVVGVTRGRLYDVPEPAAVPTKLHGRSVGGSLQGGVVTMTVLDEIVAGVREDLAVREAATPLDVVKERAA